MEIIGWIIAIVIFYRCFCWACLSNYPIGIVYSWRIPSLWIHCYI